MMLLIQILLDDEVIAEAKNIRLEDYSTTTLRKFYFFDIQQKTDNFLLQTSTEVDIKIFYFNKSENDFLESDYLEMRLYEVDYSNQDLWAFEGRITHDPIYRQGIVDVYNHWFSGREVQWNALPEGISIEDYILACMKYSSISEITPEKDIVEIDFRIIKSELDFTCAFSEEFLGKRSYMGRLLDSFDDCLLTLYNHRGRYFEDKSVRLKNVNRVVNEDTLSLIDEAKAILNKYKFNVVTD